MLVQEIQNGNQEAFDKLMQNHQHKVYHIAYGFAKSKEGALDISQNVFLKTYENLDRFRGDAQFKTWLLRITYNESHNWIKKNRKHTMFENFDTSNEETASSITHEDEYLISENRTLLLRSLYELNTKYRLAVILRYFENYPIKDIAEILKCSEGVVKNMLFRSLQKLKKILLSEDFGEKK
jgi:RNA polymerase sigma-70 factor (ECF subfamily)